MFVYVTEAIAHYPGGHDPLTPIEPDIHVVPTLADIRAGHDAVLDRAVAELQRRAAD